MVGRHSAVAMFLAGFLFDVLTIQRIDARTDLGIQLAYLLALTALLVLQQRADTSAWTPGGRLARAWHYNVEALHFLYGGLLSAYVVLYVRSSTATRSTIFVLLLVSVFIVNEVPAVRRGSYRLRLGLYGFCVLSFLNYFLPIVLGRMGGLVFFAAVVVAAGLVWGVASLLLPGGRRQYMERLRLAAPAGYMLFTIGVLYALRLVPPVPLSVQFQGIYHDVQREGSAYTLIYVDPSPRIPWRRDAQPFLRRDGDRMFYFARIFAPAGFSHRVVIRWEAFEPGLNHWTTTDRIPLSITGGRAEGFRGTAVKSNFHAGRWRVTAESEDGRAIATVTFEVRDDTGTGDRAWKSLRS